ncbi:hypothetical protein PS870_06402 [Pseudomonas fluorescens]|uniref:Uncharacterized protein n=1 Tax=Pseudomonas fluorescens TaxID=294 RepID=A0A5E7QI27_PSEFL|nr:hypothetical protein [Pseudomonas fluorescens]VVP61661.1 hypothetical protein PS870_06402 [Pseudomonas fluorescens]
MSKLSRSVASALSFAHLAGIGSMRGKKARAGDDDDEGRNEDRAENNERDDDDDNDRENSDGKKSRKAKQAKADEDADDDDEHAEDNDPDDDGDDKKSRRAKGKKASNDDDDPDAEDDEDEMHGKSAAASARRRERARCAAIFGSRAAAKNPALAANLAFNTSMTRQQALNVLRDTPADSPTSNGRSARNPNLGAGGEQPPSRNANIEARWDRAMSKACGR